MYVFLTDPIKCVYVIEGKTIETFKVCALYSDDRGGQDPRLFKIARTAVPLFSSVCGVPTNRIFFDEHGRAIDYDHE